MNARPTARWRWIRLACLLAGLCVTGLATAAYIVGQPSEAEQSLRLHLLTKDQMSPSDRVRVLRTVRLFDAASRKQERFTVCIGDGETSKLAHFWRTGKSPADEGGVWRSNSAEWLTLSEYPSDEQIADFDEADSLRLIEMMRHGYLPRPSDRIDFVTRRLTIQAERHQYQDELNEDIDSEVFARLLKGDPGGRGRIQLRAFTFAPFHNPRWFAADDGVYSVDVLIRWHEKELSRNHSEQRRTALQLELDTLHAVKSKLETLAEHGVRFHLRAHD